MPLTEQERRALADLELRLADDDPQWVARMRGDRDRVPSGSRRRLTTPGRVCVGAAIAAMLTTAACLAVSRVTGWSTPLVLAVDAALAAVLLAGVPLALALTMALVRPPHRRR